MISLLHCFQHRPLLLVTLGINQTKKLLKASERDIGRVCGILICPSRYIEATSHPFVDVGFFGGCVFFFFFYTTQLFLQRNQEEKNKVSKGLDEFFPVLRYQVQSGFLEERVILRCDVWNWYASILVRGRKKKSPGERSKYSFKVLKKSS